jgi:hypothetical protein
MEDIGLEELLKVFSSVTQSVKPEIKNEDIKPIFDHALQNFESETSRSFEEYKNTAPSDMKAHIFDILCKHFMLSLTSKNIFMQDENTISEISKRIQHLMD